MSRLSKSGLDTGADGAGEFHAEDGLAGLHEVEAVAGDGLHVFGILAPEFDLAAAVLELHGLDRLLVLEGGDAGAHVLLPIPFCNISKSRKRVEVDAVKAEHFANVPRTKSPDQVTRLEEDMISGYYGGGTLYATPQRQEPWL